MRNTNHHVLTLVRFEHGKDDLVMDQRLSWYGKPNARISYINFDTVGPVITSTSPAINQRVQPNILAIGTCEGVTPIYVTGNLASGGQTISCSSNTSSNTFALSGGEGSKSITITQTDLAANSSSVSLSANKDATPPALAISTPAFNTNTQSSIALSITCGAAAGNVTVAGINVSEYSFKVGVTATTDCTLSAG